MLRKNMLIGAALLGVGLLAGVAVAPVVRATGQAPFSASLPLLQEVYQTIVQDYYVPVDQNKLAEAGIAGITNALNDPYTVYYTPAQYQQFTQAVNGQYAGIGCELTQTAQGVAVMTVFRGTPAAKAGVQPGDIFAKVDGHSVASFTTAQVANAVRGAAGTTVTIEFLRGAQRYTVKIMRALITIPTATAKMLPGGIGLITLSQFSSDAAQAFQGALAQLQPEHPRAYILDLRDNPGGYVDQAVAIARDIIPQGKIATLEGRNFPAEVYTSQSGHSLGAPLVVLVDGGTASAAEILSAAIAQNHEGTLMGTQTFGKGIAQDVLPMQGGGYLKITVAQWMTPDGSNIEHRGIAPSYVVTGAFAPLVAAQAHLGGQKTLTADLRVGSPWVTSGGDSAALGQAPIQLGGQIYLSPTAIEDATGALVYYNQSESTFEVILGQSVLTLPLGNPAADLNGTSLRLSPALTSGGHRFIPLSDLEKVFSVRAQDLGGGRYALRTTY